MSKELVERIEKQLAEREQELANFEKDGTCSYELVECPEDELECAYSDESIEFEEEVYEIDRMESMYVKPDSMRLYLIQNVDYARMRLEAAKEL